MLSFKKVISILLCFFACSFLSFGFAAVTDTQTVKGTAQITPPDYDEVVITKVTTISNNTTYEYSYSVPPTNIKSTITGNAGQKIVYKVEAHNYSETKSFVYAGAVYDSSVFDGLNKLNISASSDQQNLNTFSGKPSDNHYEGVAIKPGQNFVFYVTYTLKDKLSIGEVMVNYSFKEIIYTITYLDNNQTFATDHITNNSVAYTVRTEAPSHSTMVFDGWINAGAVVVKSIPAGNTRDYTLSASWANVYLIIFVDPNGSVLYQEQFTSSSTKLSSSGQATVDAILAQLNAEAQGRHMKVSWSEYDIASATSDIIVKAIITYEGILNLVPVDESPKDGIVEYYQVEAVDSLPEVVEVPGEINGVPVKVINRITNIDGESDWNNYEENVKTIIIGEGVERLEWNSLAWTPNLATVKLPSTINYMAKNTFSRNDLFGNDKKVLIIEYNGTKAQWKALLAKSDSSWDGGLKKGSIVKCSDGYFELQGTFSLSWNEKSY